jgi:hypothetical protein
VDLAVLERKNVNKIVAPCFKSICYLIEHFRTQMPILFPIRVTECSNGCGNRRRGIFPSGIGVRTYPLTRSGIEAIRCLVGVNPLSIDPIQSSSRQSGGNTAAPILVRAGIGKDACHSLRTNYFVGCFTLCAHIIAPELYFLIATSDARIACERPCSIHEHAECHKQRRGIV